MGEDGPANAGEGGSTATLGMDWCKTLALQPAESKLLWLSGRMREMVVVGSERHVLVVGRGELETDPASAVKMIKSRRGPVRHWPRTQCAHGAAITLTRTTSASCTVFVLEIQHTNIGDTVVFSSWSLPRSTRWTRVLGTVNIQVRAFCKSCKCAMLGHCTCLPLLLGT